MAYLDENEEETPDISPEFNPDELEYWKNAQEMYNNLPETSPVTIPVANDVDTQMLSTEELEQIKQNNPDKSWWERAKNIFTPSNASIPDLSGFSSRESGARPLNPFAQQLASPENLKPSIPEAAQLPPTVETEEEKLARLVKISPQLAQIEQDRAEASALGQQISAMPPETNPFQPLNQAEEIPPTPEVMAQIPSVTPTTPPVTPTIEPIAAKPPPEDELAKAQQESIDQLRNIAMMKGMAQLSAGIIGAGGRIKVEPGLETFKSLEDIAKMGPQNVKERLAEATKKAEEIRQKDQEERTKIEFKYKKQSLEDNAKLNKDANDPESGMSKVMQQYASSLDALKGVDVSQLSYAKLLQMGVKIPKNVDPLAMMNMQYKLQRREDVAKQNEELNQRAKDKFFENGIKMLETSTDVKKLREKSTAFAQIPTFVKAAMSGKVGAIRGTGAIVARAMGEVGVLTEADVTGYITDPSYAGKLSNWFANKMQGKMPEPTGKSIAEFAKMVQDTTETRLKTKYNQYASMIKAGPGGSGLSNTEILQRLGAPGYQTNIYEEAEKEKTQQEGKEIPQEKIQPKKQSIKSKITQFKATDPKIIDIAKRHGVSVEQVLKDLEEQ